VVVAAVVVAAAALRSGNVVITVSSGNAIRKIFHLIKIPRSTIILTNFITACPVEIVDTF